MEIASDDRGGGATTTLQSLTSQHSTLRESFIASDLAETTPANPVSGDHRSVAPVSAVTLGAVLNYEKKSPPPATASFVVRTLLDIIKNDEITNRNQGLTGKKSWKFLKDRLRFKRVISAAPIPQHNILLSSNHRHLRGTLSSPSLRRIGSMREDDPAVIDTIEGGGGSAGSPRAGGVRLAAALAAEREQTRRSLSRELVEDEISGDVQGGNEAAEESAPQPARMSLMDLLEETDRQAGVSGPTYRLFDDDEDEVEVAEEVVSVGGGDGGVAGGGGYSCCVCMVRHKGAAFIPCGHTFCRLCSRELWVQRGNCPICNNFILEILDIF